jgi:hypothetical protein
MKFGCKSDIFEISFLNLAVKIMVEYTHFFVFLLCVSKMRVLLISNSTQHGGGYLEHCSEQIRSFLGQQLKRVLFVPFALHDHDA